jgi:hypothetical protein
MMKKLVLVFIAVACMSMSTQAKILRVNNVSGMAPYQTIRAAVDAAQEGDTIMVDGSSVNYPNDTISKRIALIGPGYFLRENDIGVETVVPARINGLVIDAEGCTVAGMDIHDGKLWINAPKTIITRCKITGWTGVEFTKGADGCVFHQNYITCGIGGNVAHPDNTYNHQFTNNIMIMKFTAIHNSYIAYNTSGHDTEVLNQFFSAGNIVERNMTEVYEGTADGNTYRDNYKVNRFYYSTDKQVLEKLSDVPDEVMAQYGAFAGDDPYVISGIPAGPVIERLTVPVSVEEGSKLNVTIKLGLQK